MIYRLGIYDFERNDWVSGIVYKFLKNPSSFKYSGKKIINTSNTISGFINFEWGNDQQTIGITVSMSFSGGYKDTPAEDAKYFEEKFLKKTLDSRSQRWVFGTKDDVIVGFIQNYSYDRNAEKPNTVVFNISFLKDDYNKNYNTWIDTLNTGLFAVDEPINAGEFLDNLVDQLKAKIKDGV